MSRLAKTVAVVGSASVVTLLGAGAASAHVTVNPNTATGGSETQLTFRAPNEEAKLTFTKLTIHLPAAQPLGSVGAQALPGWTVSTTQAPLAKPITTDDGTVTVYTNTVTWTATAGGIEPEEYQNFNLSVGPLPDKGTMTFTADQTYSDGTVVKWDEPTKPGGAEPEHPAPVLTLITATTNDGDASGVTVTAGGSSTHTSSSDGVARGLGVVGIVLGAVGLGAAGLAFRGRARRA